MWRCSVYPYFMIFFSILLFFSFVFRPQENCYIVRDHILAFCFSLLEKDLDTFHKLFLKPFLVFFLIISGSVNGKSSCISTTKKFLHLLKKILIFTLNKLISSDEKISYTCPKRNECKNLLRFSWKTNYFYKALPLRFVNQVFWICTTFFYVIAKFNKLFIACWLCFEYASVDKNLLLQRVC